MPFCDKLLLKAEKRLGLALLPSWGNNPCRQFTISYFVYKVFARSEGSLLHSQLEDAETT